MSTEDELNFAGARAVQEQRFDELEKLREECQRLEMELEMEMIAKTNKAWPSNKELKIQKEINRLLKRRSEMSSVIADTLMYQVRLNRKIIDGNF